MFMSTLDQEGWQKFLMEINQKEERKVDVEDFGEPILLGIGLDKEAREDLLSKAIHN